MHHAAENLGGPTLKEMPRVGPLIELYSMRRGHATSIETTQSAERQMCGQGQMEAVQFAFNATFKLVLVGVLGECF